MTIYVVNFIENCLVDYKNSHIFAEKD